MIFLTLIFGNNFAHCKQCTLILLRFLPNEWIKTLSQTKSWSLESIDLHFENLYTYFVTKFLGFTRRKFCLLNLSFRYRKFNKTYLINLIFGKFRYKKSLWSKPRRRIIKINVFKIKIHPSQAYRSGLAFTLFYVLFYWLFRHVNSFKTTNRYLLRN